MDTGVVIAGAYDRVRDPLEFMRIVGDDIAKSGMFGCSSIEQGRILALTCLKKGLDPMSLVETYHLFNGELSMRADAMLAGLSRVGGRYRIIARGPEAAEIEIQRGEDRYRFALTWEEAQKEPFTKNKKGELKDNYATPRSRMQMLWARVVSDGVRTTWPEVVCGVYTPEELGDLSEPAPSATSERKVDNSVVDGTFTVVADHPAPGATVEQQSADGYCSASQSAQIRKLFADLKIDADAQSQILAKRRVQAVRSLTSEQAVELIAKLESQIAASQPESQPVDAGQSMELSGPATADQVAAIKSLLTEIEQREPGTVAKVSAKLKDSGLAKLADLNFTEARNLEQALKVKNLVTFFEASLRGFKPGN